MQNRILAALPENETKAIGSDLRLALLSANTVLGTPESPMTAMYFPAGALIAHLTIMTDGTVFESATIGVEGLSGLGLLSEDIPTPAHITCKVAGSAYAINAQAFKRHLNEQPVFSRIIQRYTIAHIAALTQSVACNRLHQQSQRCATQLLLAADHTGSTEYALTHEALALMLGVHRPAASLQMAALQRLRLIAYRRGAIKVLDRDGLMEVACECYRIIHETFDHAFALAMPDVRSLHRPPSYQHAIQETPDDADSSRASIP